MSALIVSQSVNVDIMLLLNIIGAGFMLIVFGPIAWILRGSIKDLREVEKDVNHIKTELPKVYVRKDDYREDMTEIKELLRDIYNKIDGKADK